MEYVRGSRVSAMNSIGLDLEAAVANPQAAVEKLKQVEAEAEEFTVLVRVMRAKFEALAARPPAPWPFPRQNRGSGPSSAEDAGSGASRGAEAPTDSSRNTTDQQEGQPRAGEETKAPGAAAGAHAPWRVRVLAVLDAGSDRDREWTVREISEAAGRANHRSMRLLLQELVAEGLLTRRNELPRSVFYRRVSLQTAEEATMR